MKQISYLAGLPRSGSTLLSNLLAMHPNIQSTPSSPLCAIIQNMRKYWSDDNFLLAQLDDQFPIVHERLRKSIMAFMQAWSSDTEDPVVIDKNRGWLFALEWLKELDPDFKIIVTLRDLRDVYASIEKRHRETLFIDFPDHMEHNIVDQRANVLFNDNGIVGSVLKAIQNVGDIPDIIQHIYYWRLEDFLANPQEVMDTVFKFFGVDPITIDFDNIVQSTNESDSFHRMKYSHKIYNALRKPSTHKDIPISPRIINEIESRFQWFFNDFYSDIKEIENNNDIVSDNSSTNYMENGDCANVESTNYFSNIVRPYSTNGDDTKMIQELENAIQKETQK